MDLTNYVEAAKKILQCDEPILDEKPFGLVVVKGNWKPSRDMGPVYVAGDIYVEGKKKPEPCPGWLWLGRDGLTIHERMIILSGETDMVPHPETKWEVIKNYGD